MPTIEVDKEDAMYIAEGIRMRALSVFAQLAQSNPMEAIVVDGLVVRAERLLKLADEYRELAFDGPAIIESSNE